MKKALKKKLIAEATAIGFVVIAFGLEEKHPAGFFRYDIPVHEVARRIIANHKSEKIIYEAALAYQKGYQAMLDSIDIRACAYNPEIKRRVTHIKKKLAEKLRYALIESFARTARLEQDREKMEMRKKRAEARALHAAAKAAAVQELALKRA